MPPKKQPQHSTIKIILLITILAGAGYLVYSAFLAENTISHTFITWEQAGSEVTTAKLNQPVTLKLDIFSNIPLGYKGKVKVQIKKDVKWGKDIVAKTSTIDINIPILNKSQQVSVTFTPTEKTRDETGEGLEDVIEYFYTLSIGDKPIYDPIERGSRNGLLVSNKAGGGTVPQVTGILFNDRPQIEVASGTAITTKVTMSGKGKGTLKVEIRKDRIGIRDGDTYKTLTKEVTLDGDDDETIPLPTWKAVSGGLLFREYFARVYWNGDLIYDPEDPQEREYVKIASTGEADSSEDDEGQIVLKSVTWNVNPNQYSTATLTFIITGTYSKAVTIDIRKDVNLWDGEIASIQKQITGTDEEVNTTASFIAPSAGSWLFVRVQGIYDNIYPDERKAQGTEIEVSSTSTGTIGTTPTKATVTYNTIELRSAYGSGTKINVPSSSEVQVYATVTSSASTSGTLSVEVRKDHDSLKDDITHAVLNKQATLQAGTNTIYMGSFIASDVTDVYNFRQYFFKPSWNGNLLNDPDNPKVRESVETYVTSTPPTETPLPTPTGTVQPPVQQGTIQVIKIGFGNPPQDVYTANKGEYVPVYAYMTSMNGNAQGAVKIEIRKDYVIVTDSTTDTLQSPVSINNGETKYILIGNFVPDSSTGYTLREYFGRAYLNGNLVYNPENSGSRPHVIVE